MQTPSIFSPGEARQFAQILAWVHRRAEMLRAKKMAGSSAAKQVDPATTNRTEQTTRPFESSTGGGHSQTGVVQDDH